MKNYEEYYQYDYEFYYYDQIYQILIIWTW